MILWQSGPGSIKAEIHHSWIRILIPFEQTGRKCIIQERRQVRHCERQPGESEIEEGEGEREKKRGGIELEQRGQRGRKEMRHCHHVART